MERPGKKPRACVPCHQRKVRCDLALSGTPCTRCVNKDRIAECMPLSRSAPGDTETRKRAAAIRNTGDEPPRKAAFNSTRDGGLGSATTISPTETVPCALFDAERVNNHNRSRSVHLTYSGISPASSQQHSSLGQDGSIIKPLSDESGTAPYTMSEDDAHLQTLYRMSQRETAVLTPETNRTAHQPPRCIFQYYSDFNALSLLGEGLGSSNRRRLVQVELDGPQSTSAKQRELSRLDEIDQSYLAARKVHDFPDDHACDMLLSLFFKHVYPYSPVVDRCQLVADLQAGNCSSFLLHAIFSITVPYSDDTSLRHMGYDSVTDAQRAFFSRARLLFDFGCEANQLTLLQGSFLLSSFQNSFAPDKDCRFWLNQAIHIATLMGLHRRNVENELRPSLQRVCRRIWWLLYQRDIMFMLAGFENVRHINDEEVDSRPVCPEDWLETAPTAVSPPLLPAIPEVQIQFFIENCKLTKLGAECLRLSLATDVAPSMSRVREIGQAIVNWRVSLPAGLRAEGSLYGNQTDIWQSVILIFGFRLECLFYRTVRRFSSSFSSPDLEWVSQRLLGAMLDLSTVLRRAMALDILSTGPPALIVCTTQLLALQIETVLSPQCSRGTRHALKADINAMLAHLEDVKDCWLNAKWASRVFGWVVGRTGLSLREPELPRGSMASGPDGGHLSSNVPGASEQPSQNHPQPEYLNDGYEAGQGGAVFDPSEGLPETWLEDMMNSGILEEQDRAIFDVMDMRMAF